MHQRLRDCALAKNHELRSKLVWVGSLEPLKKRAKQRATFFLVGNGNLVSGVSAVGEFRRSSTVSGARAAEQGRPAVLFRSPQKIEAALTAR